MNVISATAIYRHYKTKGHLLADVVAKGFIEFNTFVEGSEDADIFEKCDNYLSLPLIIRIFMTFFLANQ